MSLDKDAGGKEGSSASKCFAHSLHAGATHHSQHYVSGCAGISLRRQATSSGQHHIFTSSLSNGTRKCQSSIYSWDSARCTPSLIRPCVSQYFVRPNILFASSCFIPKKHIELSKVLPSTSHVSNYLNAISLFFPPLTWRNRRAHTKHTKAFVSTLVKCCIDSCTHFRSI